MICSLEVDDFDLVCLFSGHHPYCHLYTKKHNSWVNLCKTCSFFEFVNLLFILRGTRMVLDILGNTVSGSIIFRPPLQLRVVRRTLVSI